MTPATRRVLRARAHHLQSVVTIGEAGLTPAVLKEIETHLKSQELIKVRAPAVDRHHRIQVLEEICRALEAQPVQHIGKVLVVFRPRPEEARRARIRVRDAKKGKRRAKRSYQMQ